MTGSTWWRFGSLLILIVLAACEPDDATLTAPESEAPGTDDAVLVLQDGLPDLMKLAPNAVSLASSPLKAPPGGGSTVVYSSLGDPAVTKERIEIFGSGVVVEIEDFSAIRISKGGRTRSRKATQDKGQAAMMRAFLSAVQSGGPAPIPLAELAATTEVTFDMVGLE